jgi:plastocyanin
MRRWPLILLPVAAVLLLAAAVQSLIAQSAPRDGRVTVVGKVTSDSEVPLSEMVVYLEPAGGDATAPSLGGLPPPNVQVRQKGAKFDPALVIVSVGQTVEFHNDEDKPIEHNVFSNAPAKKFDLGLYPPRQFKSVTFDKPGAVMLYCSIHRFMDGAVYVCPTRFHSRVAADGTYAIADVPSGKYTLKTWQRRRRFPEKSAPLDLTNGKPRMLNLELRRP